MERRKCVKIIECNLPHRGNWTRRSTTDEIILHHAEASCATVWDINQWHLGNGWSGIGYNYYIRKDGSVYRGRPEWAMGAHAVGHNDRSIGICCEGAYMTETMPQAQLDALKALLRDITGRYGKLPLRRHRDVNSTSCPGDRFPWAEVQRYNETEDGEVVKKKIVCIDGKKYTCDVIMKDGTNYVQLADLAQAGYGITYDANTKVPGLLAPQTRVVASEPDADTQAAVDTVRTLAGLEEQTIAYLLRYKHGDELVQKLAKALTV